MTHKTYKKYFIRDSDSILIKGTEFFETLNWFKAYAISVLCIQQINDTLRDDAINDEDSYVGNMKVTTGLLRSLEEIYFRFPEIKEKIDKEHHKFSGRNVNKC